MGYRKLCPPLSGLLLLLAHPGCSDGTIGGSTGGASGASGSAGTAGASAGAGGRAGSANGGTTSGGSANGGTTSGGAAGQAGSSPADAGGPVSNKGCFAFDKPSVAALRASPRKVFAHYFSPFPLSLDNQAPDRDYYARHYLSPSGESGKFQASGGYLRDRPLPMAPSTDSAWFERNYELEILRAIEIGIDGFFYNMLNTTGTHWTRLGQMLGAAERVDSGFKIGLMPDMYATFTGEPAAATQQFVDAIAGTVSAHPNSVWKLADGRVVIAPYGAEKRDAAWWSTTLAALTARGVRNAFMPLFSNTPWQAATTSMKASVPLWGTTSWGLRTPSGATSLTGAAKWAHDAGLLWMAPVAPQDMRPKDLVYWEAQNSLTYRSLWQAAISGGADFVHLITWNDYSEHSEVSPSERTQYAFADLTAYYSTWFKTGSAPSIVRDRLFYFHRSHSMSATPDLSLQTGGLFTKRDSTPVTNEIELVALLAQPGTLSIRVGSQVREMAAPAGLTSFRAPLTEGRPEFRLVRNGTTVASVTSNWTISNSIVYQDPLYRAGGMPRCDP